MRLVTINASSKAPFKIKNVIYLNHKQKDVIKHPEFNWQL